MVLQVFGFLKVASSSFNMLHDPEFALPTFLAIARRLSTCFEAARILEVCFPNVAFAPKSFIGT